MHFYLTDGIFHREGYPPSPTPQSISFEFPNDAAEITIPAGTTSIWRCAFSDCRNVEKISIPDSVGYIGLSAFSACASLKEISIPHNISAIGSRAFHGCRSLKSITRPSSISTVAEYTFCGCASLQTVELPDSIYSISSWAFGYCGSLEDISIPASVENIGRYVFHECRNLRSITLAAHHLREPELQETLQNICIIRCIAPIDDIPDKWRYKACLGFAENEAAYSQSLREGYLSYLRTHAAGLCQNASDHPQLLRILCREKLIDADSFSALLDETLRRENTELTALLLEYSHRHLAPAADDSSAGLSLD